MVHRSMKPTPFHFVDKGRRGENCAFMTRPHERASQIASIVFSTARLQGFGLRFQVLKFQFSIWLPTGPVVCGFAPLGPPAGFLPPHTRDHRLPLLLPSRTYFLSKACISFTIPGWLRDTSVVSSMSLPRS